MIGVGPGWIDTHKNQRLIKHAVCVLIPVSKQRETGYIIDQRLFQLGAYLQAIRYILVRYDPDLERVGFIFALYSSNVLPGLMVNASLGLSHVPVAYGSDSVAYSLSFQ